jgi:Tfp pilus assembly protein PilF
MNYQFKNGWILFPLVRLFLSNCSVPSESSTTAEDVIQEGWDLFEQAKYESALKQFNDAVDMAPKHEGGYHGKGWCYLLLNQPTDAIDNFNQAITLGNQTLDPVAGLAGALLAIGNYSEAIIKSEAVLQSNAFYYFNHKPSINFLDLRLILAIAYYHEGLLSKAQEQINYLDPTNTLKPDDPNSWIVNQISYASYAEALMALIDKLDAIYGGG